MYETMSIQRRSHFVSCRGLAKALNSPFAFPAFLCYTLESTAPGGLLSHLDSDRFALGWSVLSYLFAIKGKVTARGRSGRFGVRRLGG